MCLPPYGMRQGLKQVLSSPSLFISWRSRTLKPTETRRRRRTRESEVLGENPVLGLRQKIGPLAEAEADLQRRPPYRPVQDYGTIAITSA